MSTPSTRVIPRRSRPIARLISRALICGGLLPALLIASLASAAPGGSTPRGPITALQSGDGLSVLYLPAEAIATGVAGPGVLVSNAVYSGHADAAGTFSGPDSIIGFGSGAVLSTGNIAGVIGPNTDDRGTTQLATAGAADLQAATGLDSFDAAALEFDFVPSGSTMTFRYVFASEDYNEFVYAFGYADGLLMLVNGVNCATIGGTLVSVNTINGGDEFHRNLSNPDHYRNNDLSDGPPPIDTGMDGLTVALTCTASVNAGETNHLRIVIGDSGDAELDSAVFIEQGSLTSNQSPNAVDDSATTMESVPVAIDVLANDSDPDGQAISVFAVTQGGNGSVTADAGGTITYSPEAGFSGTDSFAYEITDGSGGSDVATVTVTVEPAPTPTNTPEPTATDTAVPTATFTPEPTATDTPVIEPTATETPVVEPTATETPVVEPTATNTDVPPTDTPAPTETSTPEPTATNTALPAMACDTAHPSQVRLWPPNGDFYEVQILGLTGFDGAPATILITDIRQDEPVSSDGPDAKGEGTSTAFLRALRDGGGNGRVYHIAFLATDSLGTSCSGEVIVSVPHDDKDVEDAVDDGPVFSSQDVPKGKNKQQNDR
jgi:hypothetical protein